MRKHSQEALGKGAKSREQTEEKVWSWKDMREARVHVLAHACTHAHRHATLAHVQPRIHAHIQRVTRELAVDITVHCHGRVVILCLQAIQVPLVADGPHRGSPPGVERQRQQQEKEVRSVRLSKYCVRTAKCLLGANVHVAQNCFGCMLQDSR